MERKINVIQQDGETYYKVADISKMLPSGNDYLLKKLEIETVYLNEDNHVRPYKYIDDAGLQILLGYLRSEKGEYMRADMIESAAERGLADLSVEPVSKDEEYGELVHPKFGTIRTLTIDGMTLYCGIDVATVLKFPKPNVAADRGWSDNAQQRRVPRKNGKLQFVTFIDENGVYKLIHDSGHPDAENFQYWLFTVMNPKIAPESVETDDKVSYDAPEDNNNMSVTIFSNDEFGDVRTIMIDGDPWFAGRDIATALGYKDAPRAVRDHVDEEDKGVCVLPTPRGEQESVIINESGMYSLIMSSKLESAKRFKRWVTSEVLPTIHMSENKGAAASMTPCKIRQFDTKNETGVSEVTNEMFGNVRIISENGSVLFCGADVAKALGYTRPNDAINAHCRYTVKRRIPHPQSKDKEIEVSFITEGDVYRLIVRSKLPSADKFERWLFDEVVPTIRKTGGYIADSDKMVDTYCSGYDETTKHIVSSLLGSMKASQDKINGLQREVDLLSHQARTYNPKAVVAALVRSFAAHCLDNDFQKGFRLFYKDLYYKKQIMLNRRLGGKSQLDRVRDDEWYDVVEVAVALCVTHGVDVERAINSVNNELIGA